MPQAALSHLDEEAVQVARQAFAKKYANRFRLDEVEAWPVQTFLERARLTQEGQLTRTTLLLLGKAQAAHWLLPHPAQLTWKLEGSERAYQHYDLSAPEAVRLVLHGGVVDPAYSRLLIQKTDLPLADVMALDRVQKRLPLEDAVAKRLRQAGLIEGRKPNYHVSAAVAQATASQVDYIRMRAQDDDFYAKLVTDYIEKFGQASRTEINHLLLDKLRDGLSQEKKSIKINSLLTKLRRNGVIFNAGSDKASRWRLVPRDAEKK